MSKTEVLLVGESWVSAATHYKGCDQFSSVTFHRGAEPLVEALRVPDSFVQCPGYGTLWRNVLGWVTGAA